MALIGRRGTGRAVVRITVMRASTLLEAPCMAMTLDILRLRWTFRGRAVMNKFNGRKSFVGRVDYL